ncbi:SIS domain-containing protein [Streptomyces sp. NPDC046215]|uniref:Bifunctional phosphoglucose/phosphomannose isomerase n=1 Tax=Streptomyces stramineus TaxID=173861 RepID=A0ABN1ADM7_9ACTN
MQSRIDRYEAFLTTQYRDGFRKPEEYSISEISPALRDRMKNGHFKRVVFTGMGCSAIVSDVVRAFFNSIDTDLEFHVFNDYDFRYLIPASVMDDERTLIVLSSYSGHSTEPLHVFHRLAHAHDRVLLLTSGGKLGELGQRHGVSIARWQLTEPDREYPLFHVGQYFAILLDMFFELGLISQDFGPEVAALPDHLETDFTAAHRELARTAAARSRDANVIMLASPLWHESLLKLAKMHLNEMAMVPATRNFFHEFCHSEVATLSDPTRKHSVLIFQDDQDDAYTRQKMTNLVGLLTSDLPQNRNIEVTEIPLTQPTFMRKYFTALELVQYLTLDLGRYRDTTSRNLISEAAGNPWYHGDTIRAELAAG